MTSQPQPTSYTSLLDRVIVVSGGANGIGAAVVEHCARQGCQVVFLDIANDTAASLIESVSQTGVKHVPVFYECDVTDIEGMLMPTAAKILADYPRIDGLMNNACGAAKAQRLPTMEVTPKFWNDSVAVNLSHQFFLTQALMPGLLAAEAASIINMGSISWAIPLTGFVPYASLKSAVRGLTKTLAHELGSKGIRVNSIMPGAVATESEKRDIQTPEMQAFILERQALKKLIQPEDIAKTALWLFADDSAVVTSQSIVVDAGWI